MPDHDPLAHLLRRMTDAEPKPLLRSNARVPVPGRPGEWMEPITRPTESRRNQAKVMALRKFLGIPGDDYGDISQADYEEAAADAERRQQGMLATQHVQPAEVRGRYDVEAAEAQGRAYSQREGFQQKQQARQLEAQAAEGARSRAGMAERQQRGFAFRLAQKTPSDTSNAYASERTNRSIQAVDELLPKVSYGTAGVGSLMRGIPGTSALAFATQLKTLTSNIAFAELQAMREASRTGGALGQVSDKESELLQSVLGGLDQAQSPTDLREQLLKVRGSLERWRAAQAQYGQSPTGLSTTDNDSDWEDVR